MFHLLLHFLIPAAIASLFYRPKAGFALLLMLSTMLVDIDHLFADPTYDPNRCSIGFHPFHRLPIVASYALLLISNKTRLLGLGLLTHMVLDSLDCKINTGDWMLN